MKMEESYISKIQYFEKREPVIKEEQRYHWEHKLRDQNDVKDKEIQRLTIIINVYKEKLARRESENRNITTKYRIELDKLISQNNHLMHQVKTIEMEWTTKYSLLKA